MELYHPSCTSIDLPSVQFSFAAVGTSQVRSPPTVTAASVITGRKRDGEACSFAA